MKKVIKSIVGVLLILSIIFSFSACSSFEDSKNAILEQLSSKYNEEFEIDRLNSTNAHSGKENYSCHSLSHPDNEFLVNKEGKKIEDGYFGILASEKCNELVNEIVKPNAEGYKVFCSIENDYFDNEYTNPDNLENYIENANDDEFNINIYLFVLDESKCDTDKIVNELSDKFSGAMLFENAIIQDQFDLLDKTNYKTYYNKTQKLFETTIS